MQCDQADEHRLGIAVQFAIRIAKIIPQQTHDRHDDKQRIEQPMGDFACQCDASTRRRRWRRSVPEAQGQPNRNQRQNGDTEIVVHSCKIGIQRGGRFAVLRRLDNLAHAFAEDKLDENEARNQPVQADLVNRVALNGANPVSEIAISKSFRCWSVYIKSIGRGDLN